MIDVWDLYETVAEGDRSNLNAIERNVAAS